MNRQVILAAAVVTLALAGGLLHGQEPAARPGDAVVTFAPIAVRPLGLATSGQVEAVFFAVDRTMWNERAGHYDHRKGWLGAPHVAMHRWCTGPMLLALAHLLADGTS